MDSVQLNSGKSSLTNMELTQLAHTLAILIYKLNVSMSTSTKQLVADMCHAQSSWIWSQARWILCEQDHLVNSFDLTTLSLVNRERATIGPKDITPKAPNSSILSWMLYAKRQNLAIACKVFRLRTVWAVVLAAVWEHC